MNVFASNIVSGAEVGGNDGELAFFPGIGAIGATITTSLIESEILSPAAIRG